MDILFSVGKMNLMRTYRLLSVYFKNMLSRNKIRNCKKNNAVAVPAAIVSAARTIRVVDRIRSDHQ